MTRGSKHLVGDVVIEVAIAPASELGEAKAKFVVMSNALGGIRDYDRGGWLVGQDAHGTSAANRMANRIGCKGERCLRR